MKTLPLALAIALAACTTSDAIDDSSTVAPGGKADDGTSGVRGLPATLAPWGGSDTTKWTPEAIVANAATPALQHDPTARVSIPAQLSTSSFAPYGDGQTNAAIALAGWKSPPVVGVRSGTRITVRFARELPITDDTFEVWTAEGTWVRSVVAASVDGDRVIELARADLSPAVFDRLVISPRGWRDGFPLAFDLPLSSIDALAATLPSTLATGEPVVDPVGAARSPDDPAGSVRATLATTTFPSAFVSQTPFHTETLHAAFPTGSAPRITAVGGAATWLAGSPFKNMYVCLDRRAADREAQYGVPSGAGWHHIGDPGEAIVASLERDPLLIGHARGAALAPPANGGFAYGLGHATTFALLQPGEAFTSLRGEFHWYAVHAAYDPCVQIWAVDRAP